MVGLRGFSVAASLVVAAVFIAFVASAQPAHSESLGFSRQVELEEYQAAQVDSATQRVSAPLMVILAYGLMWLAVLLFVWASWRRIRAIMAELRLAQERLSRLEKEYEDHRVFRGESP